MSGRPSKHYYYYDLSLLLSLLLLPGRKFDLLILPNLHNKQTPSPLQTSPLSTMGTPLEA